jgi:hypothetical protein
VPTRQNGIGTSPLCGLWLKCVRSAIGHDRLRLPARSDERGRWASTAARAALEPRVSRASTPSIESLPQFIARRDVRRLGLPLSPATLANWAAERVGPPYYLIGRSAYYLVSDLLELIEQRRVNPQTRPARRPRSGTDRPHKAAASAVPLTRHGKRLGRPTKREQVARATSSVEGETT